MKNTDFYIRMHVKKGSLFPEGFASPGWGPGLASQEGRGPGPYGPTWAHMGPYGPLWAHMDPKNRKKNT